MTPEEADRLREDQARARADFEADRARREKACRKAQALFARLIGREAYRQFCRRGHHEILGPSSGKRYRLRPGSMIEVMRGLTEDVDVRLCIVPDSLDWMPPYDHLIHQLLILMQGEAGEAELERMARRHSAA